jgi:RNA polymerase sigma factor (TIGR02999 family)
MTERSTHDVTGLLLSWRQGDAAALDRLVPLVYDELRRVARRRIRGESPGHALQATALVHEVYLRLVDVDRMTLTSRAHFFGVAATLMRQILVDHARRQRADKRGGSVTVLSLDEALPAAWTSSVDVLALDQALDALSAIDSRQCRVVELRFFAARGSWRRTVLSPSFLVLGPDQEPSTKDQGRKRISASALASRPAP